MTKKLEELFDLPEMDQYDEPQEEHDEQAQEQPESVDPEKQLAEIQNALDISTKINLALKDVQGMENHDGEMDAIADKALDAYQQLMNLGHNVGDMAAGQIFSNAASMLETALKARDSKVSRKLKQIDLMLKKANLDHRIAKEEGKDQDDDAQDAKVYDRNELIKMFREQTNKE